MKGYPEENGGMQERIMGGKEVKGRKTDGHV